MTIFIVVFVVMLTVVLAMSIGVISGRKPIGGSCGGLGAVGLESNCQCKGDKSQCKKKKLAQEDSSLIHRE